MEKISGFNVYTIFEKCRVDLKALKSSDKFFNLKYSTTHIKKKKSKSNVTNDNHNSNKKILLYLILLNLFYLFHSNSITLTTISINNGTNYKILYTYYISFAISDIKVNDQSCLNFESQICNFFFKWIFIY